MPTEKKDVSKAGFGEHLRREREMRGISLDEITAATRIGPRFLEALENEQWDHLPGGIFNRGFVRAIAHHLGLNDEQLLSEYTLATGDLPSVSSTVVRASAMPEPGVNWFTWVMVLVILGAVAFGGWYGWRRHMARKNAAHASTLLRPTGGNMRALPQRG